MIGLRDYQQSAVDSLEFQFKYFDVGALVAPTRSGKTITCLEVAAGMDLLAVVCTPRIEIACQWFNTANQFWPGRWTTSMMGDGIHDASGTLVSCTIASLALHLNMFDRKQPTLLIFDEAHRAGSRSGKAILRHFRVHGSKTLLTTASPRRADQQTLADAGAQFVVEIGRDKLVDKGILIDPEVLHVECNSDYDVAEAVVENRRGPALVFARTKEQAGSLCTTLAFLGLRSAVVTADTPRAERADILNRYRRGEIDALCNVQVVTEGIDLNMTETVVFAYRARTESAEVQRIGRALGAHADEFSSKSDALVIFCQEEGVAPRVEPQRGFVSRRQLDENVGVLGRISRWLYKLSQRR